MIPERSTVNPQNFGVQLSISFTYCYNFAQLYTLFAASKYFGAIALKLSLLLEWPISHYDYTSKEKEWILNSSH